MKKIMSISVLFVVLIPTISSGQAESVKESTLKMPTDEKVPETYLIKKGDTLWDISKNYWKLKNQILNFT